MFSEKGMIISLSVFHAIFLSSSLQLTAAFLIEAPLSSSRSYRQNAIDNDHFRLSAYRASRSAPLGVSDRSKRQERVGQLVRFELSRILHSGLIKGDAEYLNEDLRQRISIVSADVSPDLRQARISISVRTSKPGVISSGENELSPAVEKRQAYSWLVRNTKPLRHSLAQKMKHMKSCPNLSFVQVDVAAATDVMYLIDKVSAGAKREELNIFDDRRIVFEDDDFDDDVSWDDEEDFL